MTKGAAPAFSIESYRTLLRVLKQTKKPFVGFETHEQHGLLLRHDIDYNLKMAASVAHINNEEGICATFFIMLSCPLYSVFEPENIEALRVITANKQQIGLHYDHRSAKLDLERLEMEFQALKLAVPEARPVVAWHNPGNDLAELNQRLESAGYVSTYSDRFFGPGHYFSDSNLRNTPQQLAESVETSPQKMIQILLHPFNWIIGGDSMDEILQGTFRNSFEKLTQWFIGNRCWTGDLEQRVIAELGKKSGPGA